MHYLLTLLLLLCSVVHCCTRTNAHRTTTHDNMHTIPRTTLHMHNNDDDEFLTRRGPPQPLLLLLQIYRALCFDDIFLTLACAWRKTENIARARRSIHNSRATISIIDLSRFCLYKLRALYIPIRRYSTSR
uniref:Secreted protein n=1 Tax=Trichogramma kaykai TaxID=54128 RepID=A0ABD2VWF5_9HYME